MSTNETLVKIYVVFRVDSDDCTYFCQVFIGAFSTKQKAEDCIANKMDEFTKSYWYTMYPESQEQRYSDELELYSIEEEILDPC
jgi:hypothetical protein